MLHKEDIVKKLHSLKESYAKFQGACSSQVASAAYERCALIDGLIKYIDGVADNDNPELRIC